MNRSEKRSVAERAVGFAAPEDCGEREFLMTLDAAAEAALCRAECAKEMVQDIRDMIALRLKKRF